MRNCIVLAAALASRAGAFVAVERRVERRAAVLSPRATMLRATSSSRTTANVKKKSRRRFSELSAASVNDDVVVEAVVEAAVGETFQLYEKRWVQLAMLSMLALISDWVCFATAAAPMAFERATGHEAAGLIDIFLVSNVASCLFFTDLSRQLGLKKSMIGAAILMSTGCLLRSGIVPGGALPAYPSIVAGTILVGFAQPIFQCSPPLLSATWFARDERAVATATALNANQLGIAAAFVVGGAILNRAGGDEFLPMYFGIISIASVLVTFFVVQFFDLRPPSPPTSSAKAAIAQQEEGVNKPFEFTYPKVALELLRTPGFLAPLAAFVASIGITNVISAFAGDALTRSTEPGAIVPTATVGALFQVAIVLGGIVLGSYVDKTQEFKRVVLSCLVSAFASILILGVACGYDVTMPLPLVVASILVLGATVGPVQPIAAELAVEVSHPQEETAVEATQQLSGNLFSAILVPLYQYASFYDLQFISDPKTLHFEDIIGQTFILPEPAIFGQVNRDIRGDTILLTLIIAAAIAVFSQAKFVLKRSEFEDGH